jgi:glutamine amidotransferase
MKIGILDYGMGNLKSVYHALYSLGEDPHFCSTPDAILSCDKLVIPGVGAFGDCIGNLRTRKLVEPLNEFALTKAFPVLGICLGMQVMAARGFEGGEFAGLGWFDADVIKLHPLDTKLRIPHVGWNTISFSPSNFLFRKLPENPDVYFVHSFYMKCNQKEDVGSVFDYGGEFTAAVRKNNIFATQFHPEKSQEYGLQILQNFIDWKP